MLSAKSNALAPCWALAFAHDFKKRRQTSQATDIARFEGACLNPKHGFRHQSLPAVAHVVMPRLKARLALSRKRSNDQDHDLLSEVARGAMPCVALLAMHPFSTRALIEILAKEGCLRGICTLPVIKG